MGHTELASPSHLRPASISMCLKSQEKLIEIFTLSCVSYAITGKLFILSEPHMITVIKSDGICKAPDIW